ncbi:glycosyltransferase family 2 protein [Mesorhizobium japonicum]|uniref:glycosyltransferase family 2 protein n=1 Tax=Mesorhizobium japonicum TaxID=2066070 RepID=UPI003B5A5FD7
MKLSVVIPAYNEERYIGEVIRQVLALDTVSLGYELEVIVVNDGSSDRTEEIARAYPVTYVHQENAGKGAAVQHGIRLADGDFILVQDADLEYDIADIIVMLRALNAAADPARTAVYGSRVMRVDDSGRVHRVALKPVAGQSVGPWVANLALSMWVAVLYGRWISDTLTGYKLYPSSFFDAVTVRSTGFEADHEMTAQLIRRGYSIVEVPASYTPRSREEGKKISALDGLVALRVFFSQRFTKLDRAGA